MNRRQLFGAAVAATAVAATPATASEGRRVSVLEGEEGYDAWVQMMSGGLDCDVYLNGVLVKDVEMADERLGLLRRAKRNRAGEFYIDPAKGDEIAREYLKGQVRLVTRPRFR
jgi:hypothetical protein